MKYKIYTYVLVSDAYGSFNNAVKDDLIKEKNTARRKIVLSKGQLQSRKTYLMEFFFITVCQQWVVKKKFRKRTFKVKHVFASLSRKSRTRAGGIWKLKHFL